MAIQLSHPFGPPPDTGNGGIPDSVGKTKTALYDEAGNVTVFDAVVQESHSFDSEISDHPAEDGSIFSDMQRQNPPVVTLSILQSNNPIGELDLDIISQVGAGLASGLVAQVAGQLDTSQSTLLAQARGQAIGAALSVVSQFLNGNQQNRDFDTFENLKALKNDSTRITIVTPFVAYTGMILQSVNVTKDKDSIESLRADLVFRKIQIYSTQSAQIEVKAVSQKTTNEATPKKKQGTKDAPEVDSSLDKKATKVADKRKSILRILVDFFSGDK